MIKLDKEGQRSNRQVGVEPDVNQRRLKAFLWSYLNCYTPYEDAHLLD